MGYTARWGVLGGTPKQCGGHIKASFIRLFTVCPIRAGWLILGKKVKWLVQVFLIRKTWGGGQRIKR